MYDLLNTIQSPVDLRALDRKRLPELARQLREFLIESVANSGGHLSSNLGTVELTVALGARCGNGLSDAQLNHLDHFSKFIGLAFQVVDDVLDADSSTVTLGKTAGKDARNNKPTYVSVLGIGRARELARELRDSALLALEQLPENGGHLRQLADFIVLRKF